MHLGRGECETLAAALLFSFQILALENPRYAGNRGLSVTFVMFLGITVLFVPVTVMTAPDMAACFQAGRRFRHSQSSGAWLFSVRWGPIY